jgi:hypothetical protein
MDGVQIIMVLNLMNNITFCQGNQGYNTVTLSNNQVAVAAIMTGALNGVTVTDVCSGQNFNMALSSAGTVYAVGANGVGQLGDGAGFDQHSYVAVTTGALSGVTVAAISCGTTHTLALSTAGHVYSWGAGSYGALGDGTTTSRQTPIAVSTTGVLSGVVVSTIRAQYQQSLAVGTDGKLYSWGFNTYSQIAPGSSNQPSPVVVYTTGLAVSYVASGSTAYDTIVLASGMIMGPTPTPTLTPTPSPITNQCYGISDTSSSVCHGRGKCIGNNQCQCNSISSIGSGCEIYLPGSPVFIKFNSTVISKANGTITANLPDINGYPTVSPQNDGVQFYATFSSAAVRKGLCIDPPLTIYGLQTFVAFSFPVLPTSSVAVEVILKDVSGNAIITSALVFATDGSQKLTVNTGSASASISTTLLPNTTYILALSVDTGDMQSQIVNLVS